jgi:hypothetical protein
LRALSNEMVLMEIKLKLFERESNAPRVLRGMMEGELTEKSKLGETVSF